MIDLEKKGKKATRLKKPGDWIYKPDKDLEFCAESQAGDSVQHVGDLGIVGPKNKSTFGKNFFLNEKLV